MTEYKYTAQDGAEDLPKLSPGTPVYPPHPNEGSSQGYYTPVVSKLPPNDRPRKRASWVVRNSTLHLDMIEVLQHARWPRTLYKLVQNVSSHPAGVMKIVNSNKTTTYLHLFFTGHTVNAIDDVWDCSATPETFPLYDREEWTEVIKLTRKYQYNSPGLTDELNRWFTHENLDEWIGMFVSPIVWGSIKNIFIRGIEQATTQPEESLPSLKFNQLVLDHLPSPTLAPLLALIIRRRHWQPGDFRGGYAGLMSSFIQQENSLFDIIKASIFQWMMTNAREPLTNICSVKREPGVGPISQYSVKREPDVGPTKENPWKVKRETNVDPLAGM